MKLEVCHDANFLSLAAPEVVLSTSSSAANGNKVGIMTSIGFQCLLPPSEICLRFCWVSMSVTPIWRGCNAVEIDATTHCWQSCPDVLEAYTNFFQDFL